MKKPTFQQLREHHGISREQLSHASYLFIRRIERFEETNEVFFDQLDGLLNALYTLTGHRYKREDISYVPALRYYSIQQSFEGPLPEKPTIRQIQEHHRLDAYLIAQTANVAFRDVEEVLIGRPVHKAIVENMLRVISLYLGETYTVETVTVSYYEDA